MYMYMMVRTVCVWLNDRECNLVAVCRWCDRGRDGRSIEGHCGDYDECWFGQIGHLDPYTGLIASSLLSFVYI